VNELSETQTEPELKNLVRALTARVKCVQNSAVRSFPFHGALPESVCTPLHIEHITV
jgi:hypothetical protein